jgi:O-acetyl-ADP-ribose deacetylase (regulator of RNase III)
MVAVVNPVNCVGIMGKGLALQFKKKYPLMFVAYKKMCNENKLDIGCLHIWKTNTAYKPKYIINFPTKRHYKSKSSLFIIRKGLLSLVAYTTGVKLQSIALPAIGCGLGGLNWPEVKDMIIQELSVVNDLSIHIYEPN